MHYWKLVSELCYVHREYSKLTQSVGVSYKSFWKALFISYWLEITVLFSVKQAHMFVCLLSIYHFSCWEYGSKQNKTCPCWVYILFGEIVNKNNNRISIQLMAGNYKSYEGKIKHDRDAEWWRTLFLHKVRESDLWKSG